LSICSYVKYSIPIEDGCIKEIEETTSSRRGPQKRVSENKRVGEDVNPKWISSVAVSTSIVTPNM